MWQITRPDLQCEFPVSYTHLDVYKRQITNCFTITIKGVISDLIGVLYLLCFHCTYDDRVDRRNNILISAYNRVYYHNSLEETF